MFLRFRFVLFLAIALPCVFVSCDKDDEEEPYDVVVDFQDADIPNDPGYIENAGAGLDGVFTEGIISFPNYFNTEFNSWSGFAYSQVHDVTTNHYTNFGVYVTNDPSANKFMYVYVADPNDYSPKVSLTFTQPVKDIAFDVANATYAALCMKDGDDFGTDKFADNDWFKLDITAIKSDGSEIDYPSFNLATGSKINDFWTQLSLEGTNIVKLQFSLLSSKYDQNGMLTPAYFCIDNIKARIVK